MMTLTASPKTTRKPAPVILPRRTETASKTSARPSFWMTLMRALAAPSI